MQMITGGVTRVGDAYLLQLQLMNARDGKVVQRVSREHPGAAEGLLEEVRAATNSSCVSYSPRALECWW